MGVSQGLLLFYDNIEVIFVVLARMIGFILLLPVFTGQTIPNVVKLMLVLCIAYIAVYSGMVDSFPSQETLSGFAVVIAQELFTGMIVSFVVYLLFTVFYFVGQLVDYQIGFSMVSVLDPTSQLQVPITGNLYYLIVTLFFVQSGGLSSLISAVYYSYNLIPPGSAYIVGNNNMILYIIGLLLTYFSIGLRIALPVIGTIVVIDIALGILTKAVPQMNIFVVGMPIKLIIGLIVLYLIIPTISPIFSNVFEATMAAVTDILKEMMT